MKYYRVIATNKESLKEEVLFGSDDKNDCVDEKREESHNWKPEYKAIKIVTCEVEEEADNEVYSTVTSNELWLQQAPSFNFELDEPQLLAKALELGFVTEVGKNSYLINTD